PSHFAALQKMGNRRNSLRSDTPVSDPFSVTQQNATSPADFKSTAKAKQLQKQLQPQLQKQNQLQPQNQNQVHLNSSRRQHGTALCIAFG
ncbi:hypothetical protein, partial [Undibacterium sp.]|uniref:hypothetical protein n=1 Tax=Undibacterium sp. TaxID=1914977 RepID=UPI00374D24F9